MQDRHEKLSREFERFSRFFVRGDIEKLRKYDGDGLYRSAHHFMKIAGLPKGARTMGRLAQLVLSAFEYSSRSTIYEDDVSSLASHIAAWEEMLDRHGEKVLQLFGQPLGVDPDTLRFPLPDATPPEYEAFQDGTTGSGWWDDPIVPHYGVREKERDTFGVMADQYCKVADSILESKPIGRVLQHLLSLVEQNRANCNRPQTVRAPTPVRGTLELVGGAGI